MDEKICPICILHPDTKDGKISHTCIRERCAWWCSAGCNDPSIGACAIPVIALTMSDHALK